MTPPTSLSTLGPTACGSHVIIGASDSSLSPRDSPPLPTKGPTKTGRHQCGAVLQHRPSPKQVTALHKPCGVHCRCVCRSDGRTLSSAGGTAGRAPAGPLAAAAPNKLPALLARGRDKAQTSRLTWLRLLSYLVCACVALGCYTAANAARQQLPSRPPAASVDAHGVSSLPQPVKRFCPPGGECTFSMDIYTRNERTIAPLGAPARAAVAVFGPFSGAGWPAFSPAASSGGPAPPAACAPPLRAARHFCN